MPKSDFRDITTLISMATRGVTYCYNNDLLSPKSPSVPTESFVLQPGYLRVPIPRSVWGAQVLMSVTNKVMRKHQKFSQVYEFIFAVSICQKFLSTRTELDN